jgi:hypothetical protein
MFLFYIIAWAIMPVKDEVEEIRKSEKAEAEKSKG